MYLMCGHTPVMKIDIDKDVYEILNKELMPYSLRGAITTDSKANYGKIIEYLSKRTLSLDKQNAKKLLNAFNLSQSQDPVTKAKIAITYKATSMIDNYWINDDKMSLSWDKMNLKHVKLNEIVSHIMLFGKSLTATGLPHTPELTGKGSYAQAWMRDKEGLFLYKRGTDNGQEAKIEASVSTILDCFDVEHVCYELVPIKDGEKTYIATRCENMSTDNYCIVPAEDIYSYCCRNNIDYKNFVLSIDKDSINKMNVVDYLISNSDRHMLNWGFFMSNDTGDLLKCHPLFDHNNAFDEEHMLNKTGGDNLVLGGTKREVALKAIKETPLICIKPITKNMFISNLAYESFMQRAVELGLYKEQKKTFPHIIGIVHYEKYVPVKIGYCKQCKTTDELYKENLLKHKSQNKEDGLSTIMEKANNDYKEFVKNDKETKLNKEIIR